MLLTSARSSVHRPVLSSLLDRTDRFPGGFVQEGPDQNQVGDAGVEALAAGCPALRTLHLGQNLVTDRGAQAVAALSCLTALGLGTTPEPQFPVDPTLYAFCERELCSG